MKKTEPNDQEIPSTANMETTNSGTTHRGLKPRHSQMIALGGCVGTGLFVGTGATLATGGPAFILAAFIMMSIMVYCIVTVIIEISAYLPISGASMSFYATRYVSPSLGVAMGWLYVYSLGILVPYEITAGALVIDFWNR
jgi:amino acid transporter